MKINIKNNKGITLATTIIAVVLMVVIVSSIILSKNNTDENKDASLLNSDIEELTRKVNLYYLQNGTIPIDESILYTKKIENEDEEYNFYRLVISNLDNLNLRNLEELEVGESESKKLKKGYVIHPETHLIYYGEIENGNFKPVEGKYSENYENILKNMEITNVVNDTTEIQSGEILKFSISGDKAIVTGLTEYGKSIENLELVIPKYYKGKKVTEISGKAFSKCRNIVTVKAPETLTNLNMRAFCWYNDNNDVIPNTMLKNVEIKGVTFIGDGVFYSCIALEKVDLGLEKAREIKMDRKIFFRCGKLSLDLTNLIFNPTHSVSGGYGEKCIGESVFYGCYNVTGTVNLEGIERVCDAAFYNSGITKIINYDNLRKINTAAFKKSNITGNLDLSKVQTIGSEAFAGCYNLTGEINLSGLGEINPDNGKVYQDIIYRRTFIETGITSVVGADHIVKIENSGTDDEEYGAFYGCKNLISINLQNVEKIDKNSFRGCQNLKDIGTLEKVTEIEEYAFYGCEKLNPAVEINLSNVEYIGIGAFDGCAEMVIKNLNLINLKGSSVVTYFKENELAYYIDGTPVIDLATGEQKVGPIKVVSKLMGEIGKETFNHCEKIKNIIIPESISKIGKLAFNYCDNIQSIKIPSSIVNIEYRAFYGCGKTNGIGNIIFNINMSKEKFENDVVKIDGWNAEIIDPKYIYTDSQT